MTLPSPLSKAARLSRSASAGVTTGRGGSKPPILASGASDAACSATSPGMHDHRDAALADRLANGDFEGARHLLRIGHQFAIVAAFLEQRLRMGLLEIAGADLRRRNLRGDRQHRHPRAVAIKQAVDQMQIARSAAAGADREFAGQMRFGAGRESGNLFMPDMNPLDLGLPAQRVGQPIQAVADDAIDPLDARPRLKSRQIDRLPFSPCFLLR